MKDTQIVPMPMRCECVACGTHTYRSWCGTCGGVDLVPLPVLAADVRAPRASSLDWEQPPEIKLSRGWPRNDGGEGGY